MTDTGAARAINPEWNQPAPHQARQRKIRPLLPADDPFGQPPAGYECAQPGTVLRSRDVEVAFAGLIPQRVSATQLLYRTADMNGSPQATVTTVLLPSAPGPETAVPLVSYQCAIDGIAGHNFPSYAFRRRSKSWGAATPMELFMVAALLNEGWAVSVPDHEGPHGTWTAPRQPGYCVLDGVRAALNTERFGFTRSTPVALWGYSGGGLASSWAAEMSAGYAPELNIVGAVLGSPVGDPGETVRRLNGSLWAGLPAMAIEALSRVYPDLDRVLTEHVSDEGRALLRSLETRTIGGALVSMARKDVGSFIDQPLDDLLELPAVRHVFADIRLGSSTPSAPLLVIQAVRDQAISVHCIDELVDTYRAGGADVLYHRDTLSEHVSLQSVSVPMVLQWLNDRFGGRPAGNHPVTTGRPALLRLSTYRGLLRLAIVAVKVLTGLPLGRRRR